MHAVLVVLQVSENAEIQNIKQILGLQHGKAYDDVKALRYGHLMIMTDQVRQQMGCWWRWRGRGIRQTQVVWTWNLEES